MFLLQNPSPRSPSRLRLAKSPALARLAWTIMVAAVVNPSAAEEPKPLEKARAAESAFLRLSKDADGDLESLDTSIVRYAPPKDRGGSTGIKVDLVAAVHIGSRSYYENLETRFKGYDCVLYELVAPEKSRVPKPGRKPSGMIGQAQSGLTSLLGLEFQLERIDYAAKNFVHADLSPQEFDAAMAKRGESWWTMFSRVMRESMARADRTGKQPAAEVGLGDIFGILFGNDRELRLRRLMAEQFTDMEVLTAAFGGEKGSSLITDRNAAALDVLKEQIAKGRRKIAIFYGAAHMDDFDQKLRRDFQLQPRETVWLEAWDLREPAALPAGSR